MTRCMHPTLRIPSRRPAWRRGLPVVVLALVLGLLARPVMAQMTSLATSAPVLSGVAAWNVSRMDTSRVGTNWLSIIVTSGAVQHLATLQENKQNAFPAPVSITTQWSLTSLVSVIDVVGYFAAPSAALVNGTSTIPSSRLEGRMPTGRIPSFTAFTQQPVLGSGAAGGTLHLVRQPIVLNVNSQAQRTDQLELRLNLQGAATLQPGIYRGTLTLRAVAY